MPASENYHTFDPDRTLRRLEVDAIRQGTAQFLADFRSHMRALAGERQADAWRQIDALRRDVADMRGDVDDAVEAFARARQDGAVKQGAALSAYMGGLRTVVTQMKRQAEDMVDALAATRKQASHAQFKALRGARQDQADLVERQLAAIRESRRRAALEQRRLLAAFRADLRNGVDDMIDALRKNRGAARRVGPRTVRPQTLDRVAPAPARQPDPVPIADDLTQIKGIGPAMADRLAKLNVTTFAALGAQDPDALRRQLGGIPMSDIPGWIDEARNLSAGAEPALSGERDDDAVRPVEE